VQLHFQVGDISIDSSDSKELSFTIQVLGRLYFLRADSRASCKDWVITLNRVKEAHLQQGNVKLAPLDFLDDVPVTTTNSTSASGGMVEEIEIAPRFVVVANRQRTRAMADSVDFTNLIHPEDDPAYATTAATTTATTIAAPSKAQVEASPDGIGNRLSFAATSGPSPYKSEKRISTLGTVVLARWTKRRSSLARLGQKLVKWARSVRNYGCTTIEEDKVHLDKHVHPPGHDDKPSRSKHQQTNNIAPGRSMAFGAGSSATNNDNNNQGLSGWIGKETSRVAGVAPQQATDLTVMDNSNNNDMSMKMSDTHATVPSKVTTRVERAESDDDVRFLS
jgi:hypothetical protein